MTITFVNAMTSLDAVDVYINGDDKDQRVVEGLAYGDTSAEFTGTAPATAILVKQNVSWGIDRWLYNTLVPTEAGKSYVIVISDFVIIPVVLDTSHTVGATAHDWRECPPSLRRWMSTQRRRASSSRLATSCR
ncbi:MAG: hypothetical protein R2848_01815 [Thermomicrobiales bacterium]